MENNSELQLAWQFIENTGTHLFLTGKAGTGKTTFLKQLKQRSPKRMVVLAPTGIAAINAGGVTIHSFFQLSFAPYVPDSSLTSSAQNHYRFSKEKRRIIRSLDLLVIDEISMVRADLLDAIDGALRHHRRNNTPFGGVQLLMIGDLQQLAPVVKDDEWNMLKNYYSTPYFFASQALKQTNYMTIELKKVYRQSDSVFLSMLNKIRENKVDEEVFTQLNKRYIHNFQPPLEKGYIRLTTHNNQAQLVNERELDKLPGHSFYFKAHVVGTFPEYSYPTDETLILKEGAQIMFVKNDSSGDKQYYNGMIGEVVVVNKSGIIVRGKDSSQTFTLNQEKWNNCKYVLNESSNEITEEIEGAFVQYPIRLAWAITIHKSQGLTFEHAIIDARNSFAHGQTYVALSRCKTLEGLVLESPLRREAIISDAVVDEYSEKMKQNEPGDSELKQMQQAYYFEVLSDLFNFYELEQTYKRVYRLIDEHFYKLSPQLLSEYESKRTILETKIVKVAYRFREQYTRLVNEIKDLNSDDTLQERINAAAKYFYEELKPLRDLLEHTSIVTDNKILRKQALERIQEFDDALWMKECLMEYFRTNHFNVSDYLSKRAKTVLDFEESISSKKNTNKNSSSSSSAKTKVDVPTDILHPELYKELLEWRANKARELGTPVYVVIQQKALIGITNLLPATSDELVLIPYFGEKGVQKYGLEILSFIRKYMIQNDIQRGDVNPFATKKKTKEEKKPKEPKQKTHEISFEMFSKGMSISTIAQERGLVEGTIMGHLEIYVQNKTLKIEEIIPLSKIELIQKYIEKHTTFEGLNVIKDALGQSVSYPEIRMVLASLASL